MSHSKDPATFPCSLVRMSLTLTFCIGLASCSNFSASDLAKKSVKSVSNSVAGIMPSRIPIATVRKGDLEKMPTGADRALAWERHLNRKRYAFSGWSAPKNYKPPRLPDELSLPVDGGLLPPLHPGQGTTMDASGKLPQ